MTTFRRDLLKIYAIGATVGIVLLLLATSTFLEYMSFGPSPFRRLFLPSSGAFHGFTIDLPASLAFQSDPEKAYIWRRFPAIRISHTGVFLQLRHFTTLAFDSTWAAKDSACRAPGCALTSGTTFSGLPYACQIRLRGAASGDSLSNLTVCHLDDAQATLLLGCQGDVCDTFTTAMQAILQSYHSKSAD